MIRIAGIVLMALAGPALAADLAKVQRPFVLFTKDEVASIRARIEREPWAKAAAEAMAAKAARDADELFLYAVMGNRAAGDSQKRKLLSLLKAPDPLGAALEWRLVAYDVLYNELTAEERQALEQRFRRYIQYAIKPGGTYDTDLYNNAVNYARYDGEDGKYTRTNWLPNIIFPWKTSANLAALVLLDEKLIRDTWAVHGSLQWYFDEYLADGGFYMEEFGKMLATPGALYLYCMGARNAGLDELGFGYKGKGGATMRGHIESMIWITYPRVDLGSDRPQYPQITIGDLRPYPPFQYATVKGCFANGSGGNELWHQAGAWGGTTRGKSQQWDNDKTPKMGLRLWFELGHRFWPDAGFDYFLAQMRAPGDNRYIPQLFSNIDAIDPAKVKPPVATSAVWPQRGLAILRFKEGSEHWESPAPAAALCLTSAYAHHVNDMLALAGYYAFNRPIYLNPKSDPGYAFGFSRSVRSHCSVMVDGHIKIDDWGKTGSIEPKFTDDCTTRQAFEPEVKFVAARTKKRYEGVDETRALFLTGQYLLDVFSCSDDKPHTYTWIVHSFGQGHLDRGVGWQQSKDLADLIPQLTDEWSLPTEGRDWSVMVRQGKRASEPADSPLTDQWFDRQIGVAIRMLGDQGTTAYMTRTPLPRADGNKPAPTALVDGVTILAQRTAPSTAFVALHEPFEGGTPKINEFRRIAQTPQALAVAVDGDRLLLHIGDGHNQPVILEGDGESFTFADWGYVRIGKDQVAVRGDVRAMRLRVGDMRPGLMVNGKEAAARTADGFLAYP